MRPLTDALRLPAVIAQYHELLFAFVRRELRARVQGSVLGRVWPVLQPLLLFTIYYFIFVKILRIPVNDQLAPHGPDTHVVAEAPEGVRVRPVDLGARPAWWPATDGDAHALAFWRGGYAAARWLADAAK